MIHVFRNLQKSFWNFDCIHMVIFIYFGEGGWSHPCFMLPPPILTTLFLKFCMIFPEKTQSKCVYYPPEWEGVFQKILPISVLFSLPHLFIYYLLKPPFHPIRVPMIASIKTITIQLKLKFILKTWKYYSCQILLSGWGKSQYPPGRPEAITLGTILWCLGKNLW